MTDDCILNMEKTGFDQKNNKRKVIAVTRSKNVWSKSVEVSFHMTIVAGFVANGISVSPLKLLPGQPLKCATMDQFSITGRTAKVAPKILTKSNIFIKCLDPFSSNVPSHVKWPIALVNGGYGSHNNTDIMEK